MQSHTRILKRVFQIYTVIYQSELLSLFLCLNIVTQLSHCLGLVLCHQALQDVWNVAAGIVLHNLADLSSDNVATWVIFGCELHKVNIEFGHNIFAYLLLILVDKVFISFRRYHVDMSSIVFHNRVVCQNKGACWDERHWWYNSLMNTFMVAVVFNFLNFYLIWNQFLNVVGPVIRELFEIFWVNSIDWHQSLK